MRRLFSIFLIIMIFFMSFTPSGYGYSQMPAFICGIGIKFYQQGRYEEALHEFRKALLVQPNYEPALKYIRMIEGMGAVKLEKEPEIAPEVFAPKPITSSEAAKERLDLIEIQREMIQERKVKKIPSKVAVVEKKMLLPEAPQMLFLDESLGKIRQPIEIEQGKTMILSGRNIQRFLVTHPGILTVERKSSDELLLTGKDIGYTYLHVWDDNGRRTVEFLTVLPKPTGPTLEEQMRLEEERATSFKIRYSLDWHSFEQGRRITSLERQYYTWEHNLNLTGSTPYGNLDSTAIVKTLSTASLPRSSDLIYLTSGLTAGKFGPFKDFSLRGFNFNPGFANLASGGMPALRGGMINSPAFNKKIDYTAFWGREGSGRFGGLSPGLQKMRRAYISGFDLNYFENDDLNYGASVLRGYGRDRFLHLNDYAYDTRVFLRTGKWVNRYEIGFDTDAFAHLFSGHYTVPKLKFLYEFRNIDKNFLNINGETWRRGELGGLFTLNYAPTEDWNIYNHLDVYQDRLFPSINDDDRWNQDYDFITRYNIDPTSTLKLDYSIQNDLGKLGATRYQSAGIGLTKSFNLIRNFSSFVNFRHQERENFSNLSSNFMNENISLGIRSNLIGKLYYFADQQWNWLTERFTGDHARPQVFQAGVDLASQIFQGPFYENIRFIYRNEENASSPLSLFAGEDYIEGYAELSYRSKAGTETYCSTRIRNVWADNPNVNKRIEADFNIGMRYLWDTGIHWESVGNIEGYVFRDLNSDGLRQRDEAPVEGVKLWLGKNRSATTDVFGYYKFTKVKGKKAFVTLDATSLPVGYVLASPYRQETFITHSQTARLDFGIISRSEIAGIIFYDANDDGEYNPGETGIRNVLLTLENAGKVTTGSDGRYSFRNISTGGHEISLDLNSLPKEYLPKVPIIKKITLFEGVTYVYNIPLKKIER